MLSQFEVTYDLWKEDNPKIILKSKQIKLEIGFDAAKKYMFKGPFKGKLSRDILHHSDCQIELKIYQNSETKIYKLIGNIEMIKELKLDKPRMGRPPKDKNATERTEVNTTGRD